MNIIFIKTYWFDPIPNSIEIQLKTIFVICILLNHPQNLINQISSTKYNKNLIELNQTSILKH